MKTIGLALAGALLVSGSGGVAKGGGGDRCAGAMPAGRIFDVRDVTVARRTFGNEQTEVHGCFVTRSTSIATISAFFVLFRGDHSHLSEDGQSNMPLRPTGWAGPSAPKRMAHIAGSPHLGQVPAGSIRVLAVATWRDSTGAEQWEGHFVPFRIID